ncbi:hypothetical protein HK407_10g15550 [Ordospora pajunii]|uniref:uncharacterized protein n=1 Tax=Ordospora pajunii TaxID=3039483 RepID=UPI0029527E04|nr:uncharacterized protein HK407_10g15550 [Ordospora pajunii]KAH9410789.1 hypothetical protein HK407_10g15550 [Ordospora pajunii]
MRLTILNIFVVLMHIGCDAMAESVANMLEGLKIVPSPSLFDVVNKMKDVSAYVPQDEKSEGEGVEVRHDGRMFVVPSAEEVDAAINMLRKYPAPDEDVIGFMRAGNTEKFQQNFIVYFLDASGHNTKIYPGRDASKIFVSTDSVLASELNVPVPGAYAYNSSDDIRYIMAVNDANVKKILPLSSLPIMGYTTRENIHLYNMLDVNIFYIFFENGRSDEMREEYFERLAEFRYDVRVILVPVIEDKLNVGEYGLSKSDFPGCVSINDDGGKYVLKNAAKENIAGFIRDVIEKKATVFYKTEDEPADNEERSVKVITRNNSRAYLEDVSRDRLIVLGMKRCPHCVNIKPILERIGELAKAHANDKLVIGYCDVGLNDVNDIEDFNVRFVPAIVLYKAESNESVQYSKGGVKSFQSVVEFIRESGTFGTDLSSFGGMVHIDEHKEERRFDAGEGLAPKAEL